MNKRRTGMNKIKKKENWFSTEKPTIEEQEKIKNKLEMKDEKPRTIKEE